jgi:molecular chaperone DnaK
MTKEEIAKKEAEEKIKALKEVKDKDDVDALKKATDELSEAIQKVGAAMYQAAPGEAPAGQPGGDQPAPGGDQPKPGDGGTVDAEYKEVK